MRALLFPALLVLIATPQRAAAQADGPIAYSRPPVIVAGADRPGEEADLQIPDALARCGGDALTPVYSEVLPARPRDPGVAAGPDLVLAFSTAADGRVLDIRPVDAFPGAADMVQAAFAAWRFPAQARKDCRLTVRWRAVPVAEAKTADLLNYFAVTRTNGTLRDAVARRLGGDGADCGDRWGGRTPAVAAYPDFSKGRRPPPGGRTWTVLRWNIDAEGQATDVETIGSSGDADLDAEGRRAVAETRMRPGPARTGCVYNFHRIGETLPAPPLTPEDQREDPLQNCPDGVGNRFAARPNPVFPTAFQQRSIEGWALVRFDIAPWGEVGNVSLVEAQPAAVFGEDALRLIRNSRAAPGFDAGIRCVAPVRYRIQPDGAPAEAALD